MIYITGDVHGPHDVSKLNTEHWPEQRSLTRDNYLIVCGDMGVVWDGSRSDKYWQQWFNTKPFTTLFVDGNHENHPMLNAYMVEEWCGGKVHKIRPHVYHLMRGQVFTIHGVKVFTMGGAASHDKEFRIDGVSWWPEEMPSDEEYDEAQRNLECVGWDVDLVISHCTSDSIQHQLAYWYERDKLTNFFFAVIQHRLQYKHWYFGHYHDDRDLDEKHHCIYHEIKRYET